MYTDQDPNYQPSSSRHTVAPRMENTALGEKTESLDEMIRVSQSIQVSTGQCANLISQELRIVPNLRIAILRVAISERWRP